MPYFQGRTVSFREGSLLEGIFFSPPPGGVFFMDNFGPLELCGGPLHEANRVGAWKSIFSSSGQLIDFDKLHPPPKSKFNSKSSNRWCNLLARFIGPEKAFSSPRVQRSLLFVELDVTRYHAVVSVNFVVYPNSCGETNLYSAMWMLLGSFTLLSKKTAIQYHFDHSEIGDS